MHCFASANQISWGPRPIRNKSSLATSIHPSSIPASGFWAPYWVRSRIYEILLCLRQQHLAWQLNSSRIDIKRIVIMQKIALLISGIKLKRGVQHFGVELFGIWCKTQWVYFITETIEVLEHYITNSFCFRSGNLHRSSGRVSREIMNLSRETWNSVKL